MNKHPRFSVITVCLNVEDVIEETMLSLLNQSCKDFEYIVIDGASGDDTVRIIKKYKDKIDYFVSEKDTGLYNAMNKGAKVAKGDYLYFLNAGDSLEDSNLLRDIDYKISESEADFLYGKVRVLSKDGKSGYVKGRSLNKSLLKLGHKVGQQAVFVKREVFSKVGGLNEKYKIAADFDLLCKILDNNFSVGRINRVICNYDNNGISSDLKKSYDDTAKVIMDRYGKFWFMVYFTFTRLKLIVAKIFRLFKFIKF